MTASEAPELIATVALLPCYVVLDLETTGTNPVSDRITEIAAVRIEDGRAVRRWTTLVNPQVAISGFIENLTGISNALVADAPLFADIAVELLELLDGAVLMAHNVRFDHGFLKNELARIGLDLHIKTLCSVRLSRQLYPEFRQHSLDALMQRFGLQTAQRHRALGDVLLLLDWLAQAAQTLGSERLQQSAQTLLSGSASLPPLLETPIHELPDGPGVYLFYGLGALPLYIGKSVHLRRRVLSHFQGDHSAGREMRIAQEIRRIEWRCCAGELGALLLEARLVKQLQPVYNRQLRRQNQLCAWQLADDPAARPLLKLVQAEDFEPQALGCLYGVFRSKRQAVETLRELARAQRLCPQALGLESGRGRCFAHQLGQCQGVCCGQEPAPRHRLRLQLALAAQRLRVWPYAGPIGLREYDAASGRSELHVFDQWCHLATVQDEAELAQVLGRRGALAFDLDSYRLLLKYLDAPQRRFELLRWARAALD